MAVYYSEYHYIVIISITRDPLDASPEGVETLWTEPHNTLLTSWSETLWMSPKPRSLDQNIASPSRTYGPDLTIYIYYISTI